MGWGEIILRVIQYLPVLIRLLPVVVSAVHEIMCSIHGCDSVTGPQPWLVSARRKDFDAAIAAARKGDIAYLVAQYKIHTSRSSK